METVVTQDGDMVDEIAHRHYGTHEGTTAAVLDANPGLAALGPVLPAGVTIILPPIERPPQSVPVRLYD